MRRLPTRTTRIALGVLVLAIAVVIGIRNGWVKVDGRPIQQVRELWGPATERNQQIEDLTSP